MSPRLIAERCFTAEDQESFARFSGDRNPMHMDAAGARRTMAGFPVVHGIHGLLWALDALWRVRPSYKAAGLRVRFEKMIYLGDKVQLVAHEDGTGDQRFDILVEGGPATRGRLLASAPATASSISPPVGTVLVPTEPLDLEFADTVAANGRIDLARAGQQAAQLFPAAVSALNADRVAWLARSSFLVGMVNPGLHSIYNGLELSQVDPSTGANELCFAAQDSDPRFRLVRMHAWGGGWDGTVEAFVRPHPTAQPDMASVGKVVTGGEFAGVHALIIGGSRGLGEVIAKMLASGGANVVITYSRGDTEAAKVSDEICAAGGTCALMRYDVLSDARAQLASLHQPIDQLYYLATPPIFRRKSAVLTPGRFEDFSAFYVNAFYHLCRALRAQTGARFATFYPSSASLDSRPSNMTEYTMAKAAGEILCADMERFENVGPILVRRLPRLPTDQTATLSPVAAADPLEILLPILREMMAARKA